MFRSGLLQYLIRSAMEIVGNRQKPLILLVDDQREVLMSLQHVLEANDFAVLPAQSAQDALALLTQFPTPQVIVSDIIMPNGDGLFLHQELRARREFADVPIILLSGTSATTQRQQALASGAEHFLAKPFPPEELVALLKGQLVATERRAQRARELSAQRLNNIINVLSHEFRTPLVSVSTGTEVLLDQLEQMDKAQIRMLLETVLRGGKRLESLVEDFVMLQQINFGVAQQIALVQQNSFSLESLIKASLLRVETQVQESNCQVSTKESDVNLALTTVECCEAQLVDVLARLLNNALKFSQATPIEIHARFVAHGVEIVVRDYGSGFGEVVDLTKVFDPFVQLNREQLEQQGLGVGLTIARYLAQFNDAELMLQTPAAGKGVEAILRFKQYRREEAAKPHA